MPEYNDVNSKNLQLTPQLIADCVYDAILEIATTLRPDCLEATRRAFESAANNSREKSVLADILENAKIGSTTGAPICQDTGSVWIMLEVGQELAVPGNIFSLVNNAVERAYEQGRLRMSMVRDALFDRTNTGDNTPAFCEVSFVPGKSCKLSVMLKGGGSDNASRTVMLPPAEGRQGITQEVLACVREKAANACPPLVVGVGIGATFDKVAGLSKRALLREIGSSPESEEAAQFEAELLEAINATGIGPAALGGTPTALAVHIKTAPCHIAALPLAINLGCTAMRSKTITLIDENGNAQV